MEREVWRSVSFAPGYEVSTRGRVHGPRKMLKPDIKHGYAYVRLCIGGGVWKDYRVHRLVALVFIPNPKELPQINHIDYNPLNNSVENLEWCDQKHNNKWSSKHMSEAMTGKKLSLEHRKHISECYKSNRELPRYIYKVRGGHFRIQIVINRKLIVRKTVPTLDEALALKEKYKKYAY